LSRDEEFKYSRHISVKHLQPTYLLVCVAFFPEAAGYLPFVNPNPL